MKILSEKNENVGGRRLTPNYVLNNRKKSGRFHFLRLAIVIIVLILPAILFGVMYSVTNHGVNVLAYNHSGKTIQIFQVKINGQVWRNKDSSKVIGRDINPEGSLWISESNCPSEVEIKVGWSSDGMRKHGECRISEVRCGCAYEAAFTKDSFNCSRSCIDLND